jgi:hypothetical protein
LSADSLRGDEWHIGQMLSHFPTDGNAFLARVIPRRR